MLVRRLAALCLPAAVMLLAAVRLAVNPTTAIMDILDITAPAADTDIMETVADMAAEMVAVEAVAGTAAAAAAMVAVRKLSTRLGNGRIQTIEFL